MGDLKNCLNCQNSIDKKSIYCKFCGQKNDDNNLRFKILLKEFLENYLSLDTRIGRSILPFLFKPGVLTQKFISGKRSGYVNPFRFYLVISVLFFALFSFYIVNKTESGGEKGIIDVGEEQVVEEANKQIDELRQEIINQLDSLKKSDSLFTDEIIDSVRTIKLNEFTDLKIEQKESDSIVKKSTTGISFNQKAQGLNIDLSDLAAIKKYRFDQNYTDEQLLDSLILNGADESSKFFMLQAIRIYRADTRSTIKFIVSNYSIAMFLLIPLCAFIFMLFYYKSKLPYVGHLIHSLHLHTFTFFIYFLAIGIVYLLPAERVYSRPVLISSFVITLVYSFFSLKRVYQRTYWGTVLRTLGVGVLYYLTWLVILLSGLVVSFLLY